MTPRFFIRHVVLVLTLIACLASSYTPALASSPEEGTPSIVHVIKFYLDPALVPDIQVAKTVLSKYVGDMNSILAKNTNRSFLFDPETGIILTATKPQTDSAQKPLPTDNFEIWVHAVRSSGNTSYGGYAGVDSSGAGVLAGLHWASLYDPGNLSSSQVQDYLLQLNNMLHEFAHIFKAGIGEYYNLMHITDTTGVAPLLNIDINDSADPFWSDKPDYMTDPLLWLVNVSSRAEFLQKVRYSNLTAASITGGYRNGVPSFTQFLVQVLDKNGAPVESANVKVWNVNGLSPHASQLLFDAWTDENGQITLDWGGTQRPHNTANFLRLVKIYKDGKAFAQPQYVSIFDMDAALLVSHAASFVLTFHEGSVKVEKEQVITSTSTYDGYIVESRERSNKGKKLNSKSKILIVGDDKRNKQYLSILSFDTSSLPDNAVITSVVLKVKFAGKTGTLPFRSHKGLYADIQTAYFASSIKLQKSDFKSKADANLAVQFDPAPTNGWYSGVLRPSSFASLDLTSSTQFRLRFKRDDDNDKVADFIKFYSGNAPNANDRPQLIVQYFTP